MNIKKIIACIISCILFTVYIPFTAVADNDTYSNDFDKYRKYINPNWNFEVPEVPEDIPYILEELSEVWGDIRYYDLTFNYLYAEMTNKGWYDPDAPWVYLEEPVYFLYGHDSDTSMEFQESSKYRSEMCIPYVPNTDTILNFWYRNEPDDDWEIEGNNFITSYTQWLDSVGAMSATNIPYADAEWCCTAYRVGTMCVLYTADHYVSDFVSDCNASESEIIEKFDQCIKESYKDFYYTHSHGYESYDGVEFCKQALFLSYNCFADIGLNKLFWTPFNESCYFEALHNKMTDNKSYVNIYLFGIHISLCKSLMEDKYYDTIETEDSKVVYDETVRLMNRIKELEAENEKLKSGNNNSYTGYITIEQNNGTAAERFPVTVYSDGKTEITEEFQNYINSLNVKIEQLMSRINLISNGSCGDIDGDGNISVEDAQLLLQYYTESKVAQLTDDPIDVWYSIKYGG